MSRAPDLIAAKLTDVIANMRGWAVAAHMSADAFERADRRNADRFPRRDPADRRAGRGVAAGLAAPAGRRLGRGGGRPAARVDAVVHGIDGSRDFWTGSAAERPADKARRIAAAARAARAA